MPSDEVAALRAAVSAYIAAQAEWRSEKATEFPDDERHATSARALRGLAQYVAGLPDTDPRLRALAERRDYVMRGGDVFMPGEEAARMLSRYGFDRPPLPQQPDLRPGDESEFLDAFVAVCEWEGDEVGMDALEEAASSPGALEALDALDDAERGQE
jgi:hypothetical protein